MTTRDRAAVVEPDVDLGGFLCRMFEPHEVKAAMAFPVCYQESDEFSKGDRVRLWGNAVTPPVMTMLARRGCCRRGSLSKAYWIIHQVDAQARPT